MKGWRDSVGAQQMEALERKKTSLFFSFLPFDAQTGPDIYR